MLVAGIIDWEDGRILNARKKKQMAATPVGMWTQARVAQVAHVKVIALLVTLWDRSVANAASLV